MAENIIYLEGIDPIHLYGVNNNKLELIKKQFPKIKIIARGNEIKAIGQEQEVYSFEEKIMLMIEFYQKFNSLKESEIIQLLSDDGQQFMEANEAPSDILLYGNYGKQIKARTINQNKLVKESEKNDLIMAIGPAGTGKTYTAIALAVRALRNKSVKKIILTRPAVEAGEHLGFLPGDLKEKLDPYLQPLYDALHDMVPVKRLIEYLEEGIIEIAPLAFMRGRTLDNAFVILDEAQNAKTNQLKMFLTRMGKNAQFIVTGDITQIDLPKKSDSGMIQATHLLSGIKGISFVKFDDRDIIRHKLVKKIIEAYENKKL
jgi:phosphate starvation-inducible protein PhoH and related proteins